MSRRSLLLFLGSSLVLSMSGYVALNGYDCGYSVFCYRFFTRVADPFMYGGAALSIVFLLLLAFPQAISVWKKFAVWFVPLAALLFIFYPEPGAWDFLSPMPEQLFQWVSLLYVVISTFLIGYSYFTKRN